MVTHSIVAREPRIAVSLRLPPELVCAVEQFASEHHLSKTDAFLHFLNKGMESEKSERENAALARIEQKVSETLRLIQGRQGITNDKQLVVDKIREVCSRFPAIERAYLFGSFARGTYSDKSDIDIRLDIGTSRSFNLRDLEHFSKQVEQLTGRSADVVTARTIKNTALREAIERDKELIYERKAERSR